jgi:hypothetical protein
MEQKKAIGWVDANGKAIRETVANLPAPNLA